MTTATRISRSAELMARAERLMPGGVSSPVRGFGAVGGTPRVIERAAGAQCDSALSHFHSKSCERVTPWASISYS